MSLRELKVCDDLEDCAKVHSGTATAAPTSTWAAFHGRGQCDAAGAVAKSTMRQETAEDTDEDGDDLPELMDCWSSLSLASQEAFLQLTKVGSGTAGVHIQARSDLIAAEYFRGLMDDLPELMDCWSSLEDGDNLRTPTNFHGK